MQKAYIPIILTTLLLFIISSCKHKSVEISNSETSGIYDYPHNYTPDILGGDFVKRAFILNDDKEGRVIATLIKKPERKEIKKAVLYIHGFNDYFFQEAMADSIYKAGFDFYALDLQKYGRSLLPHQSPFFVDNLDLFFAGIDSAMNVIRSENHNIIGILAHSQGGLISSLYTSQRKNDNTLIALALNSPFLDFNVKPFTKNIAIPVIAAIGRIFPKIPVPQGNSTAYSESLNDNSYGEWSFSKNWKKPLFSHIPAGWFSGIRKGHKQLRKGLNIEIPVIVFHSDKTAYGDNWTPEHQAGDAVLSVEDIKKYAPMLGYNVKTHEIPDGLHDLALSAENARNKYITEVISFFELYLQKQNKTIHYEP